MIFIYIYTLRTLCSPMNTTKQSLNIKSDIWHPSGTPKPR